MRKKQDLRVQRTKKMLNQALLTLMEKKNFQTITIQELANEAMINRATFYLHYYDKYELLEKCIKDNLDAIMLKHVTPVRHIKGGVFYAETFYRIVTDILKSVEENERFFQIMFESNCDRFIKDYVIEIVNKKFLPQFGDKLDNIQSESHKNITIHLIVSAILGVMTWWITSEERDSPEEIANIIVGVVTKGPAYAIGLKTSE